MFVGMTDKWFFVAVNQSSVALIFYSCIPCIFNGSLGNSLTRSIVIQTNAHVVDNYRIYQGIQTSESNITNAYIFAGIKDGVIQKYFVNETDYLLDDRIYT